VILAKDVEKGSRLPVRIARKFSEPRLSSYHVVTLLLAPCFPSQSWRACTRYTVPHFWPTNRSFLKRVDVCYGGRSMATAQHPKVAFDEPDEPVSEPQHIEALEQENKELKELVIQLSKLVIKYVAREH
jgi:hypothetical protein